MVYILDYKIRVPSEIHEFLMFVQEYYPSSLDSWIQECFMDRMRQILNDPEEFGKVFLRLVKDYFNISHSHNAIVKECIPIPTPYSYQKKRRLGKKRKVKLIDM
jgi:hypothetical protein